VRCGLADAFEVEAAVGLGAGDSDLPGGLVNDGVAGLGAKQWGEDLAVGMEHPGEVRVRPGARTIGVEQTEDAGGVDGGALVDLP